MGPTKTGMRSASSAGGTLSGRRRARSSTIRVAGVTPVAREGSLVFTSTLQAASCARRSASSRKRRCLKNEPFTQPTRFSTDPFWLPRRGQHTSTPIPRSSATAAKVGFHSVIVPSFAQCRATVFGRSKTASNGIPPKAAKCSTSVRRSVSTRSFSTMVTSTHREYLSLEAKK